MYSSTDNLLKNEIYPPTPHSHPIASYLFSAQCSYMHVPHLPIVLMWTASVIIGNHGDVCVCSRYTIYLQIYQLFLWLWIMNWVVGFGQVVLAGAFASYYWAFNKPQDIPAFPISASVCRTLRYIGSSQQQTSLPIQT